MPQSNIYSAGAASIFELFGDYVEGAGGDCIALALSARQLGPGARDAIGKSLAALGYGDACTYATLVPNGGGDVPLDAQALFLLVEGLDPLCLICADAAAANAVGKAYRTDFELDAGSRAFGRPSAMFADLTSLIGTEDGKQLAWRILKTLRGRN